MRNKSIHKELLKIGKKSNNKKRNMIRLKYKELKKIQHGNHH